MSDFKCPNCGAIRKLSLVGEKEYSDFARGFTGKCPTCEQTVSYGAPVK